MADIQIPRQGNTQAIAILAGHHAHGQWQGKWRGAAIGFNTHQVGNTRLQFGPNPIHIAVVLDLTSYFTPHSDQSGGVHVIGKVILDGVQLECIGARGFGVVMDVEVIGTVLPRSENELGIGFVKGSRADIFNTARQIEQGIEVIVACGVDHKRQTKLNALPGL